MAYIPSHSDVIVDMFAGIGYFTIPMALHSHPAKIYACEKNPLAFQYLLKNIEQNRVDSIVTPILGDNREVCPDSVANRVLMGYVGRTHEFFGTAFSSMKEDSTLHYHETCPDELIPERPVLRIRAAAEEHGYFLEGYTQRRIKSYAPGISHVVVDARLRKYDFPYNSP
jgi:tRNA wybutosine-synthesizing protein 2